MRWWVFLLSLSVVLFGCDSSGGGDTSSDTPGGQDSKVEPDLAPVEVESSDYTYLLDASTESLTLWTAPATRKVRSHERAPEEQGQGLRIRAAKNEFEPVQLLLGPATGEVSLTLTPFGGLGEGGRAWLSEVEEVDGWPELLHPRGSEMMLRLSEGGVRSIWLTVYVPEGAPAGHHETVLLLEHQGDSISIPVSLEVFDFTLPREIGYATQLNVDVSSLIPEGGEVDDAKTLLHELRLTPKSVTWPSGYTWRITWENDANPNKCASFWDEQGEGEDYGIWALGPRYIHGDGWNGVGFPNAMLFQFLDNSTPRPGSFCGIERGDHHGSSAYNQAWGQFLSALEAYLRQEEMLEKAYYYVQNEPQNEADHALAAHLCRLTKAAAPELRIAISEEPKPEIAEDSGGDCGYDIWIAHVRAYEQGYAWERQRDHGEEVWIYSLDHDVDPYFNPTRVDVDGIHTRIIPWVSWSIRATGWAYYDAGRFFHQGEPTIRAALLREGIEDYEYLLLANGGEPRVFDELAVDESVHGVASSLTSWSKDVDTLMALRDGLGAYLEGSRDTLPVVEVDSEVRPKEAYYLNFQDPAGAPSASPLVVEEVEWMKLGWEAYDKSLGYGWSGEFVGNPDIQKTLYDEVDGFSEVERSSVYDDWGRDNLFLFDLPSGSYEITVGVGRPRRGYPGDPHNVVVEGVSLIEEVVTTDDSPMHEASAVIEVKDGALSLEVGGRSSTTGDYAYTFLSYIKIVPVE